ncbi:MAG: isocitrate lyase/phosphoenolpyruvate mutase family protein [Pseudomonadota bacterium]
MTRQEKVAAFRALHVPGDPFVMPNPWDLGSAKVLAGLGAKALATTSSGHAFTLGRVDGGLVSRDEALEHAAAISAAVDVPVSGDFENGYGADPETVAETVRLAAEAGLAGVSIEDTELPGDGAYAFDHAVARVEAAVEAAKSAEIVFCARADGWLTRTYDGAEALRRCRAFAEAGAEVIYAPLVKEEVLQELCSIGTPVNVLAAGKMSQIPVTRFAEIGVARISIGGALARLTQLTLMQAAKAMLDDGDLTPLGQAAAGGAVDDFLSA